MFPSIDSQITFLYTSNLVETANFYERVFGFPLALDQGACRIYAVAPTSYLGFCQKETSRAHHSDVIFTLVTSQVDAWYEHLSKEGIRLEKPPAVNPKFNIYHFFLRDPNGYLIEIQTFLDPAWGEAK
jgi:catechol 2,3-dioxygenase-like lactoylglutathione lyase family enzyme